MKRLLNFFSGDTLLQSQHIPVNNSGLVDLHLHPLRCSKVNQKAAHQGFRDLVPGSGCHGVPHHSSIPADGNIRSARPDVCQHQIQQPKVRRDHRIQSCDRLQRKACHLQPRSFHNGIQAFHHLAGQESSHYLCFQLLAIMIFQSGKRITVQQITGYGVAHQIASALGVLLIAEAALRVSHRTALQLADDIAADPLHLRQFHGVMSPLCSKRPSGGGHTYPRQPAAQRSFHSLRNPAGYLCHLLNVLNLSVQHGPAAMLLFFNSQNLQPLFHYTARHADDAAGTDVQCVDQPLVLLFPLLGHSSHLIPALTKGYMDMASRSHGTPYPLCIRKWGNASTPVNQYLGPPKGLSLRLPSIKGSAEVSPQLSAVE